MWHLRRKRGDEVIGFPPGDPLYLAGQRIAKQGADRERRRIRRAQRDALDGLMCARAVMDMGVARDVAGHVAMLDAATRAPKKGRGC